MINLYDNQIELHGCNNVQNNFDTPKLLNSALNIITVKLLITNNLFLSKCLSKEFNRDLLFIIQRIIAIFCNGFMTLYLNKYKKTNKKIERCNDTNIT